MRPSPSREENQRFTTPRNASNSTTAMTVSPTTTTTASFLAMIPLSMSSRSSSGFTTVMQASREVANRKIPSCSR